MRTSKAYEFSREAGTRVGTGCRILAFVSCGWRSAAAVRVWCAVEEGLETCLKSGRRFCSGFPNAANGGVAMEEAHVSGGFSQE